jgi:hypothetical protein
MPQQLVWTLASKGPKEKDQNEDDNTFAHL